MAYLLGDDTANPVLHVLAVTARVVSAALTALTLAQLIAERRAPLLRLGRAGVHVGNAPVIPWADLAGIEVTVPALRRVLRAGGTVGKFRPRPEVTLPRPTRSRFDLLPRITDRPDPEGPGQPLAISVAWTTAKAEQIADTAHRLSGLPVSRH